MKTEIKSIEHKTFKDNRGSYTPLLTNQVIDEVEYHWDQCSISINDKIGTLRGLHYQTNPKQTKYVKVIQGSIIDFLYNLETGELRSIILNDDEAVLVPDNMAHGFLTLEPNTIVAYMVKGEYNPDSEHSIVWNSVEQVKNIVEGLLAGMRVELTISDKDKMGK